MDQYEECLEEVLEDIEIPLEVQVAPPADNPQSPSPSPPTSSPEMLSPPQGSPVGDATSFMGFYTHDDLVELEQCAVDARASRGDPTSRIEELDVSPNLKTFLRRTLGVQWEVRLIRESGEVLIEQPRAYLAVYNQLTSFNRRQWLWLFPAWTARERLEHLEMFADAGSFWVI